MKSKMVILALLLTTPLGPTHSAAAPPKYRPLAVEPWPTFAALSNLRWTPLIRPPMQKEVARKPLRRLVMWTMPHCAARTHFAQHVAPIFQQAGFSVEYAITTTGPVPRFDLHTETRQYHYATYINPRQARELLGQLGGGMLRVPASPVADCQA